MKPLLLIAFWFLLGIAIPAITGYTLINWQWWAIVLPAVAISIYVRHRKRDA